MKLALWQGLSPAADTEDALAQAGAALRAAAALAADVLVLPEIWLPGYNQPDIPARAIRRGGPELRRLAAAAREAGCALVCGYAEADAGRIYNSAVAFGADGRELAHYRKIQLYGPREKAIYTPGDAYATFPLGRETAALLICYDVEFAPHVKALADGGATLILTPTANMKPWTHVANHTVPAMAANHAVAIVYANYCGDEGDLSYCGGSVIADPYGNVLARAGETPALLVVDLPPRDPARLYSQSADLRLI